MIAKKSKKKHEQRMLKVTPSQLFSPQVISDVLKVIWAKNPGKNEQGEVTESRMLTVEFDNKHPNTATVSFRVDKQRTKQLLALLSKATGVSFPAIK
jgi:hypothetical protein